MSDNVYTEIKPYHLIVKNNDSSHEHRAVLFGAEFYLKAVNYGSPIPIRIETADKTSEYFYILKQSIEKHGLEFKTTGIRIIAKSWSVMPKSIYYKNLESGHHQSISLVDSETWGKFTVLEKAVNDIALPKLLLSGKTKFILEVEPLSELEILFH